MAVDSVNWNQYFSERKRTVVEHIFRLQPRRCHRHHTSPRTNKVVWSVSVPNVTPVPLVAIGPDRSWRIKRFRTLQRTVRAYLIAVPLLRGWDLFFRSFP